MRTFILTALTATLLATPALAQHDHGGAGHSDKTFQQVMQSLQVKLVDLTNAVIMDDMSAAHDAAYAIAKHPAPRPEEIKQLFARLGDKAEAFKACDNIVHTLAMQTAVAAHNKDSVALGENYTNLIKQIRTCHQSFKSHVSDARILQEAAE